jgi:hypothetical protein
VKQSGKSNKGVFMADIVWGKPIASIACIDKCVNVADGGVPNQMVIALNSSVKNLPYSNNSLPYLVNRDNLLGLS